MKRSWRLTGQLTLWGCAQGPARQPGPAWWPALALNRRPGPAPSRAPENQVGPLGPTWWPSVAHWIKVSADGDVRRALELHPDWNGWPDVSGAWGPEDDALPMQEKSGWTA